MTTDRSENSGKHVELDPDHEDPVVRFSNRVIRQCVRMLSIIMVVVIVFAILDTGYAFFVKLVSPPVYILEVSDILAIFSAILMVLIAIEIYSNITLYLTADVIHVKLVVATALMAVARKVIALDSKDTESEYFLAYAALGLAFGVTYWLLSRKEK